MPSAVAVRRPMRSFQGQGDGLCLATVKAVPQCNKQWLICHRTAFKPCGRRQFRALLRGGASVNLLAHRVWQRHALVQGGQ